MNLRWDRVPQQFHYLPEAVEACGETRVVPFDTKVGRHVRFVERATPDQLALLSRAYEEVCRREDNVPLLDWLEHAEQGRPRERAAAWALRGLLVIFADLAEIGATPFASHEVVASRPSPEPDFGTLPASLAYLAPMATTLNGLLGEGNLVEFLEEAGEEDWRELRQIANRVRADRQAIEDWLDANNFVENPAASCVYQVLLLLDHANLLE